MLSKVCLSIFKCWVQGWASILFKRTERSLRSFPFFIKERNVLFGFISHTKMANLAKKERKRTQCFFQRTFRSFFNIYLYIFIYIYLYITIYIYLYIYIEKRKERPRVLLRSFKKNVAFFAFFSVLCKRTFRSLRSFPFFAKEHCVRCVLFRSLQKNIAFFAFFSVL